MSCIEGFAKSIELIDNEMKSNNVDILVQTGLSLAKIIIQKELKTRVIKKTVARCFEGCCGECERYRNMIYYKREETSIDCLQKKEAIRLIYKVFKFKKDKGGSPYSKHLIHVMDKVEGYGEDIEVSALLHDVVEDTEITLSDLKEIGFNDDVIEIVDILTRKRPELYSQYVQRILDSENYGALLIKRADLEDNMNLSRLKQITEKDVNRVKDRYIPTWLKVNKKIRELEDGK